VNVALLYIHFYCSEALQLVTEAIAAFPNQKSLICDGVLPTRVGDGVQNFSEDFLVGKINS
jgi:hypothetical protein